MSHFEVPCRTASAVVRRQDHEGRKAIVPRRCEKSHPCEQSWCPFREPTHCASEHSRWLNARPVFPRGARVGAGVRYHHRAMCYLCEEAHTIRLLPACSGHIQGLVRRVEGARPHLTGARSSRCLRHCRNFATAPARDESRPVRTCSPVRFVANSLAPSISVNAHANLRPVRSCPRRPRGSVRRFWRDSRRRRAFWGERTRN